MLKGDAVVAAIVGVREKVTEKIHKGGAGNGSAFLFEVMVTFSHEK